MIPASGYRPCWSTASYGDPAQALSIERLALGEHLSLCRDAGARRFGLRRASEALHGFVTARVVSTLLLLALPIGIAWLAAS